MAEEVRPADLAALARAFDVLEDRKRILRGKPLPGSLKPKPKKVARQSLHAIPLDIDTTESVNARLDETQEVQEVQGQSNSPEDGDGKESLLPDRP